MLSGSAETHHDTMIGPEAHDMIWIERWGRLPRRNSHNPSVSEDGSGLWSALAGAVQDLGRSSRMPSKSGPQTVEVVDTRHLPDPRPVINPKTEVTELLRQIEWFKHNKLQIKHDPGGWYVDGPTGVSHWLDGTLAQEAFESWQQVAAEIKDYAEKPPEAKTQTTQVVDTRPLGSGPRPRLRYRQDWRGRLIVQVVQKVSTAASISADPFSPVTTTRWRDAKREDVAGLGPFLDQPGRLIDVPT